MQEGEGAQGGLGFLRAAARYPREQSITHTSRET